MLFSAGIQTIPHLAANLFGNWSPSQSIYAHTFVLVHAHINTRRASGLPVVKKIARGPDKFRTLHGEVMYGAWDMPLPEIYAFCTNGETN